MKKSSEDDPEVDMSIERVPQEKEQQHMMSNPLVLTLITGRVGICTELKFYSQIGSANSHVIWCLECR